MIARKLRLLPRLRRYLARRHPGWCICEDCMTRKAEELTRSIEDDQSR